MKVIIFILTVVLAVISIFVIAHGGRTDKQGYQNDKKTGALHCH
jgi:hypothetical protein